MQMCSSRLFLLLFFSLEQVLSENSKGEQLRLEGEKLRRENKDEDSIRLFQEALQIDESIAKASIYRFVAIIWILVPSPELPATA